MLVYVKVLSGTLHTMSLWWFNPYLQFRHFFLSYGHFPITHRIILLHAFYPKSPKLNSLYLLIPIKYILFPEFLISENSNTIHPFARNKNLDSSFTSFSFLISSLKIKFKTPSVGLQYIYFLNHMSFSHSHFFLQCCASFLSVSA